MINKIKKGLIYFGIWILALLIEILLKSNFIEFHDLVAPGVIIAILYMFLSKVMDLISTQIFLKRLEHDNDVVMTLNREKVGDDEEIVTFRIKKKTNKDKAGTIYN